MKNRKPLTEGNEQRNVKPQGKDIRPTGPPPAPQPRETLIVPGPIAGVLGQSGRVYSEECLKSMASQRPDIFNYNEDSKSLNLTGVIKKSHVDECGNLVIDLLDIRGADV